MAFPWRRVSSWSVRAASVVLVSVATLLRDADAISHLPFSWCLTCPPTWLADAISNVALFVPVGFAFAMASTRGAPSNFRRALMVSVVLSLAIELLQFLGFPDNRTASVTDLVANSLGGAIGASLVAFGAPLWHPTTRQARVLSLWCASVTLIVLSATAWAVAPDTVGAPAASIDASDLRGSPLPHTPGFGWFGGITETHRVNGQEIPHRGTGPIILQTTPRDSVRVHSVERGRDEAVVVVPIMWIHSHGSIDPLIFLAQSDRDVILQARLHATRIGLATPRIRVRDVMPNAPRDSTTRTQIDAVITSRHWQLSGEGDGRQRVVSTLRLSAASGWSLIQSVVGLDNVAAPLLTVVWILLWFLPTGWFVAGSVESPLKGLIAATASSALMIAIVELIASRLAVGSIGTIGMLLALTGTMGGAIIHAVVYRRGAHTR